MGRGLTGGGLAAYPGFGHCKSRQLLPLTTTAPTTYFNSSHHLLQQHLPLITTAFDQLLQQLLPLVTTASITYYNSFHHLLQQPLPLITTAFTNSACLLQAWAISCSVTQACIHHNTRHANTEATVILTARR